MAAGADVKLTRDGDYFLAENGGQDLRERAAIANAWRADLLISIHHNAADDPNVNRTEVYYHSDADHRPASIDIARELLESLDDLLRLEQSLSVPLLSDKTIYAEDGFAILRHARVPAVLVEASYHSNPTQEQRLRDPVHNRVEAYALFLGIARWTRAGLPRVALIPPDMEARPGEIIAVELASGLENRPARRDQPLIAAESIAARLNGRWLAARYDAAAARVYVTIPVDTPRGRHTLYVTFRNLFGQAPLHPELSVTVTR